MEYVKIPRRRIAVLIGKNGAVKSKIERELQVKLDINSEEGIVKVENCGDDVLAEWKSRDIVRAVGCGMNPLKALKLKSDDYILEVIELTDIVGRSRKAVSRQKGRIIGRKGKTRGFIEEATGACVSILGKRVVILGTIEEVRAAKEAVTMLAEGIPHGVVYKVLQKRARELKEKRMHLWK